MAIFNAYVNKCVAMVVVLLGLFGSVWAIDTVFVRRNIFEISTNSLKQDIASMQKQIMIQSAYDEVFYWQKLVVYLRVESARYPVDFRLKEDLNRAVENLKAAEDRLKRLQQR